MAVKTLSDQHPAIQNAKKALLSHSVSHYELYLEKSQRTEVESKSLVLDGVKFSEDLTLSIRIYQNQKLGFITTSSLSYSSIEKSIQTLLEMLPFLESVENFAFANENDKKENTAYYDPKRDSLSMKDRIQAVIDLEKKLYSLDSRIKNTRKVSLSDINKESILFTSNGFFHHTVSSLFTSALQCKAVDGESEQMGWGSAHSSFYDQLDLNGLAHRVKDCATQLLGGKPCKSAEAPAVFGTEVVSDLLSFLSESFLQENLRKNKSLLQNQLGKEVFSKLFSLSDLPQDPRAPYPSLYDAEGTPSEKREIFKNGVFVSSLCDLKEASFSKTSPTGSSQRAPFMAPRVAPKFLTLSPGQTKTKDLFKKAGNGFYITALSGLHTANKITGQFSLGAEGVKIENGELSTPFQSVTVAGNLKELLKNIVDVGSEQEVLGSHCVSPLMVSSINLGGT